jgi:hypothetical protein
MQPKGKFSKLFYYQDELFEPTDQEVLFPLQQMSILLNNNNQIEEITSDYMIDRLNSQMTTKSLLRTQGMLHVVGQTPSEFSYLPPLLVMKRFLARKLKTIPAKSALGQSPFPESVMFALTKQVLLTKFGCE